MAPGTTIDTSSSSTEKKSDKPAAKAPASTIDTSSSSTDKKTESLADVEEDGVDEPRKSVQVGLRMSLMKEFGFNTSEELARLRALAGLAHPVDEVGAAGGGVGGGAATGKAAGAKKAKSRNKNQNIAYGADGADDSDFMDQDYDNDLDYADADDDDDSGEDDEGDVEEEDDEEEGEMVDGMPLDVEEYMDEYLGEGDDLWEDDEEEGDEDEYVGWQNEEELERQRQEAYEAAVFAAEQERERIRDERIAEIMKKKEILIERYLRIARVMINHRKKNIYLQDYLYHLAFRKGVLRGENPMNNATEEGDEESVLGKANKKRQNRKNVLMASRFARFLRKTGHFYDEEQTERTRSKHHHHREAAKSKSHRFGQEMKIKKNYNQNWSRKNFDEASLAPTTQTRHHHRHHHFKSGASSVANPKNSSICPEGQEANCSLKMKARSRLMKLRRKANPYGRHDWSESTNSKEQPARQKPKTLAEILEAKAQETMRRAFKHADEALDAFEKHRCRMAKKKQLIKITKLLERQYSGTAVTDQERNHLVSFVETSVKAQNLAKKKALRRQQRNKSSNKTGVVNFNHQWSKSLERIRELRLKKAKLEQEHRMVLLRKVKHWHVWEKRDVTALDAVYEFIVNLASKVNMTRRETEVFTHGIEFFEKQLHSLHDTMLDQVVKMFKAQNMLGMAQRQAKDNTSVAAPMMQGFSISDYERMAIENQESHQKLMERQEHLVEQYEKLKVYIKQVADSHLHKQRSWGALRTGRHDMKQLWELCGSERENLLRKMQEIRKVKKLHRRLFMQIAVVENKHVFKDFRQVTAKVKELEDIERDLQTQVLQAQSTLRVMNVKYADTQARQNCVKNERSEQVVQEKLDYSKQTIKERINPTAPNTIYNINIGSTKSQKIVLEKQKRFSTIPGAPSRPVQSRRNSNTVIKNKLPKI